MALSRKSMSCAYAAGFVENAVNVIRRFAEYDDPIYENFISVWRDMKFERVFKNRKSAVEIYELSEDFINFVKSILIDSSIAKLKIGSLFLVYGLYYLQPKKGFAKLRLTVQSWTSLKIWFEELDKVKYRCAKYIFAQLYYDGAIRFVIFDRDFGLDKYYRYYFKGSPNNQLNREFSDSSNDYNKLMMKSSNFLFKNNGLLSKFATLRDQYYNLLQSNAVWTPVTIPDFSEQYEVMTLTF